MAAPGSRAHGAFAAPQTRACSCMSASTRGTSRRYPSGVSTNGSPATRPHYLQLPNTPWWYSYFIYAPAALWELRPRNEWEIMQSTASFLAAAFLAAGAGVGSAPTTQNKPAPHGDSLAQLSLAATNKVTKDSIYYAGTNRALKDDPRDPDLSRAQDDSFITPKGARSNPNKEGRVTWAKGQQGTQLIWGDQGRKAKYSIRRDGKLIAHVTGGSFIEKPSPKDAKPSLYTVTSEDGGDIWAVAVPGTQKVGSKTYAVGPPVGGQKKYMKIWYRTFIPQRFIDAPSTVLGGFVCKYKSPNKYGGDNRGYSTNPYASFRTQQAIAVDWNWGSTAPGGIVTSNQVGKSHAYTPVGTLIEEQTASTSGMRIKQLSAWNGEYVDFDASVDSANPFCGPSRPLGVTVNTNSIGISYRLSMYSYGGVWIRGKHRLMPNHEIVATIDMPNRAVAPTHIYKRDYANPACLTGFLCEVATFDAGAE